MSPPPRIELTGAFHHFPVRGNQRQDVFLDDHDKKTYLQSITRCKDEQRSTLDAYVRMSNHIHHLIQALDSPFLRNIQRISLACRKQFRRNDHQAGHLFQGSSKALLFDRDANLLSLVQSIDLHSVRAKVAKEPKECKGSSRHEYPKSRRRFSCLRKPRCCFAC